MRDLRPLLAALVASAAACGPASFPDQPAVVAAQASWCQALAKASGAGAGWEQMGACKGASPTASAGYLRGMAKCYPGRKEAHGDKTPDVGVMVAECKDEVMFKLTIDETSAQEAINARCERAVRCEKASLAECVAGAKRIEGSQRATLYGNYNAAAIHKLADCLTSSACGDDENVAQQACYKPLEDKLLWVP